MKQCLLVFTALWLAPLATLAPANATPQPATKPNVLFIAVDDLRTSLGCYGDPLAKSPNIDSLARSARLFQGAYTHQAVCGPARAAMLTGRLPDNTRVWHNRNLFRNTLPDAVTLPQLFKNHGYQALSFGKIFSGDERELDPPSWSAPEVLRGQGPGWKNYALAADSGGKGAACEAADVPDEGYPDGRLAQLAVETLEKLKQQGQPFFLAIGFFKPHLPFNAPKKYWDRYDPAVFALPDGQTRVTGAPEVAYHTHRELGGYKDMPEDEQVSAEQARTLRHGYYACVSYVDAQLGKVLDALRRLGLDQNTIIVLWGDHGWSLGEKDRWCKGTNFERDTRVPLMIRVPGLAKPGEPTDALIEYVDIYPTLAALAGLTPPADLDGRSLVPVLEDPAARGRDVALSQFTRPWKATGFEAMGYSLRTPTQRYTRWVEWPSRKTIVEEFYDYRSQASASREGGLLIEQENVVGHPAYADSLNRLRAKLDETLRTRIKLSAEETAAPAEPKPKRKKKKTNLFTEATDGFRLYRIPGIVVTARGSVLAYCEARKFTVADRGEIEIHLRRSTDGGRTWSPASQVAHLGPRLPRNPHMPNDKKKKDMGGPEEQTVNNPVAIAARDGTVHLLYCVEYMRAFHIRSDDDGVTWSAPVEITSAFDRYRPQLNWQVIATGPGHAVQLQSGRLVAPFWMTTYENQAKLRHAVGVIYSDDHGRNWRGGDLVLRNAGEPNIAELPDGRVLVTARNSDPRNRRVAASSRDGATAWSPPEFISDLLEPGCMAGIVRHPGTASRPRPFLLFTNPDTTQREHKQRVNVTVKLSEDGGRTWPVSKLLQSGPSAYSDLAVLPDGTVLCFYESGDPQTPRKHGRPWAYSFLTLARFHPDWLTNAEPVTCLLDHGLHE